MSHDDDNFPPLDEAELAFEREEPSFEQIERSILLERLETAAQSERWNDCEQSLYLILLKLPDKIVIDFARDFLLEVLSRFEARHPSIQWPRPHIEQPEMYIPLTEIGERADDATAFLGAIHTFLFAVGLEPNESAIPLACNLVIRQAIYGSGQMASNYQAGIDGKQESDPITGAVREGWDWAIREIRIRKLDSYPAITYSSDMEGKFLWWRDANFMATSPDNHWKWEDLLSGN